MCWIVFIFWILFSPSFLCLILFNWADSPRAIYSLELFGLCWGILSVTLLIFVPKMIYVVWPPDAVEGHVNTRMSETGNSNKESKSSAREFMVSRAKGVSLVVGMI